MAQLITGREAASRLARGCSLTTRKARAVLDAGLAGHPQRGRALVLFDEEQVADLINRPAVSTEVIGGPVFVARVGAAVSEDADEFGQPPRRFMGANIHASASDQADGVRMWWRVSPERVRELAPLPFIATVSGFVAVGLTVVNAHQTPRGTELRVDAPGPWWPDVARVRMPTGRGAPWIIANI